MTPPQAHDASPHEMQHAETKAHTPAALLDEAHLNAITGGDTALAHDVLNIFTENAHIYVRNLREAQSSNDWRDAAHTLKGSARGIGAWNLADLCERAEHLSTSGCPAERSIALGDISCAVGDVVAAIAERQTPAGLTS